MNLEHIKEIQEILTELNPIGNQAVHVTDLNDYETEATDIDFHCFIEINPRKIKNPRKRVHVIVKDVLEGHLIYNFPIKNVKSQLEISSIYYIKSKHESTTMASIHWAISRVSKAVPIWDFRKFFYTPTLKAIVAI